MRPDSRLFVLVLVLLFGCRRTPASASSDWSHPETATQYRACQEAGKKDPAAAIACLEDTAARSDAGEAPVRDLISTYESGPYANPARLTYWRHYRSRPSTSRPASTPEPPPHVTTPSTHTSTPTQHEPTHVSTPVHHEPTHTTTTHTTSTHTTTTHTTTTHRSTPSRRR